MSGDPAQLRLRRVYDDPDRSADPDRETGPEWARKRFESDYHRVLYCSSFRRLGQVTQVVAAGETALFHNRLTHSLKVAQVGRILTEKVTAQVAVKPSLAAAVQKYGGGIDTRVVEAACLAHDLGHPPFGHVTERELQRLVTSTPNGNVDDSGAAYPKIDAQTHHMPDSFEGNAQSFRIVNKLAFREGRDKCNALNLTHATLAAILKYPWPYTERPREGTDKLMKWGCYNSEKWVLDELKSFGLVREREVVTHSGSRTEWRTIEAQIMDWSDDVSYAVHDIEDFFKARLIPLDALRESPTQAARFFSFAWPRVQKKLVPPDATDGPAREAAARDTFDKMRRQLFPFRSFEGTRADREGLHEFASETIELATNNIQLTDQGYLDPPFEVLATVELLKQLTWYYVINQPSMQLAQRGQVYLIRQLYRDLLAQVEIRYSRGDGSSRMQGALPARFRDFLEIALDTSDSRIGSDYDHQELMVRRAVVDYISSLTEAQAVELAQLLEGRTTRSMLDDWSYS